LAFEDEGIQMNLFFLVTILFYFVIKFCLLIRVIVFLDSRTFLIILMSLHII